MTSTKDAGLRIRQETSLPQLYRFSDGFVCGFRFWPNFFAVLRFLVHPNVHLFKVFPKLLFFKIHDTSTRDNLAIRKRLLKRCYYKTDKRT